MKDCHADRREGFTCGYFPSHEPFHYHKVLPQLRRTRLQKGLFFPQSSFVQKPFPASIQTSTIFGMAASHNSAQHPPPSQLSLRVLGVPMPFVAQPGALSFDRTNVTRYPLLLKCSADCSNGNISIELLCNEIDHFFPIDMRVFLDKGPQTLETELVWQEMNR